MLKFGLIANITKALFWKKLPKLLDWFKENQVSILLSEEIARVAEIDLTPFKVVPGIDLPDQCDMVLAFGGDGTMLHAINLIAGKETPVLGINIGKLGFLTEIPLDKFTLELHKILQGKYRLEKRLMLKGSIENDSRPLYALNEILFKEHWIRVIKINVNVDGQFLNSYIADGLLISTPTGSTAYSLASGGPIIVPTTNVLTINPISPHSLSNRPVIVPANSKITITVKTDYQPPEFLLGADGQDVRLVNTCTKILVEKASFSAQLVKPLNSNFYKLLHNKLNWGEDFRNKKYKGDDSEV